MLIQPQFDTILSIKNKLQANEAITIKGGIGYMLSESSDAELIEEFVGQGNTRAFETLMRRHYDMTYKRYLKHCRDPDNAQDLTQSLWEKQLKSLHNYRDEGKYASFLMSCVSNSLTDFWRRKGVKDRVIDDRFDSEISDPIESALDSRADTAKSHELQQQVDFLTDTLIPSLPCEQRLVFLLKHESEYWEDKQRLDWQHLADLNDTNAELAWQRFEGYRNAMLASMNGAEIKQQSSCEENLIFLVWTQAQRPFKSQDYTWQYFSQVLNLSENTLKTRYRAALKSLSTGLTENEQAKH